VGGDSKVRILGVKEGHDGAYALIDNTHLAFSLEAEKDSFPRCTQTSADLLLRVAQRVDNPPDVVAIGGWTKGLFSSDPVLHAGYFGSDAAGVVVREVKLFGKTTTIFSSSHERGHILAAYALSPFPTGTRCYSLVWEGNVGNFYLIDERVNVTDLGCVTPDPGNKYTFLFSMADPNSPDEIGFYDTAHPGKMMALGAFGRPGSLNEAEHKLIERILHQPRYAMMSVLSKGDFRDTGYVDIGVESQEFKDLARKFTDLLFDMFFDYARDLIEPGLPLLISGGCGLNCEWNSRWRDSGLFSDVFVPPCTNDSGSAIGVAVDAMLQLTGTSKLTWSAYCGEELEWDVDSTARYQRVSDDPSHIASLLNQGAVLAWVEGRYEMGPRALGHRSLIAEPFRSETRDRLNSIKGRESYRPIAPICAAEQVGKHFRPDLPSPHMLYFYEVTDPRLRAVTHVDNSARVQTLDAGDAPFLSSVLASFEQLTGAAVLCNTSLNFNGRGFINRTSDLIKFTGDKDLDGFVIDGMLYQEHR
jgi:hydroxymethyl cephem carbamoyltransferase